VIIATEKTYLGETEGSLQILPGMDVRVDIKTGTKTVSEYLLRPVLNLRYEAFRKRQGAPPFGPLTEPRMIRASGNCGFVF
jgi:hypothetical protein